MDGGKKLSLTAEWQLPNVVRVGVGAGKLLFAKKIQYKDWFKQEWSTDAKCRGRNKEQDICMVLKCLFKDCSLVLGENQSIKSG